MLMRLTSCVRNGKKESSQTIKRGRGNIYRKIMKVGIIGLGKIAQTQYLPALLKNKEVEIVALCDRSGSLVDAVVAKHGFPKEIICHNETELIEKKPEFVFLLTHNHYHIAKELIESEISICVEKPICWESVQAECLLEAAKVRHVKIYAAYMKQYDNTFKVLQKEIEKRGVPVMVNVSCYAGNNKRWCDPLFTIFKESDIEKKLTKQELNEGWVSFFASNSIFDSEQRIETQLMLQLGIHQINIIRKLFGQIKIQDVVISHVNGVCTVNSVLQSANNTTINYALAPMFSGAWLWKEKYEIVYPNALIVYHPGCPFLPISDSYLEICEGKEYLNSIIVKSDLSNPFETMIDSILNDYCSDQANTSVSEAIGDIEFIELLLKTGRNAKL